MRHSITQYNIIRHVSTQHNTVRHISTLFDMRLGHARRHAAHLDQLCRVLKVDHAPRQLLWQRQRMCWYWHIRIQQLTNLQPTLTTYQPATVIYQNSDPCSAHTPLHMTETTTVGRSLHIPLHMTCNNSHPYSAHIPKPLHPTGTQQRNWI